MPDKELPPILPPSPETLDNGLRPEKLEARDLGTKLEEGKINEPTGYIVNHTKVGDWLQGTKLTPEDLGRHYARNGLEGEAAQAQITRLVKLNALVPVF